MRLKLTEMGNLERHSLTRSATDQALFMENWECVASSEFMSITFVVNLKQLLSNFTFGCLRFSHEKLILKRNILSTRSKARSSMLIWVGYDNGS